MGRRFRQLLVSILALWYGRSQKEIAAESKIPPRRLSQLLSRDEIKDGVLEQLLAALRGRRAAVPIVSACLESLEAAHRENGLTEEEQVAIEEAALRTARRTREALTEIVLRSRSVMREGYPEAADLDFDRQRAAELVARLKDLDAEARRAVVRLDPQYQSWAVCERACEESVRQASRSIESAAAWAQLAREVADRVSGPEGWRDRNRGYAEGHVANVLRVRGELKESEVEFDVAMRLWEAGTDPLKVLDPGRLLDLKASLRKDQRRTDEALALLDEVAAIGRCPARALILKGITLEKMGRYESAVENLLRATSYVERHSDPRQWNILHFNLAVNSCHIGKFHDAIELLPQMRELASELGDEIDLWRMTWLEGRAMAGLGRRWEARRLLAEARRQFAVEGMSYDVALALLEEAALLLDEGRSAEVKVLSRELAGIFESKGVHREALAALRLFQEAVEQETATPELARRVLRFLFRARHDQGLRFTDL